MSWPPHQVAVAERVAARLTSRTEAVHVCTHVFGPDRGPVLIDARMADLALCPQCLVDEYAARELAPCCTFCGAPGVYAPELVDAPTIAASVPWSDALTMIIGALVIFSACTSCASERIAA